ncbi:class I SAM-dependent methyltransferase [Bacillus sp. REN3]|uniref:class I SAM-dependent methyltransferase n=1 Tax=Bacillus sp. REN3 TaxID=2802440 RepID=UPI001AED44BA|nr:class I SAM-dependent methyltransferase [Bacillus sp. REN3]
MGREFISLFDDWAEFYDETVAGHDREYAEVFEHYEHILEQVALKSEGIVLEFGVGTGNLTEKLLKLGRVVYGVEPSPAMRAKAGQRLKSFNLLEGDFLNFPQLPGSVDTIVSTYAFHHLTDEEKNQAINLYSKLLRDCGRIVFADTAFINEEDRQERHRLVKEQGFENLLADLRREYYSTLKVLKEIFHRNGFNVRFEKLNRYVWLMEAEKNRE